MLIHILSIFLIIIIFIYSINKVYENFTDDIITTVEISEETIPGDVLKHDIIEKKKIVRKFKKKKINKKIKQLIPVIKPITPNADFEYESESESETENELIIPSPPPDSESNIASPTSKTIIPSSNNISLNPVINLNQEIPQYLQSFNKFDFQVNMNGHKNSQGNNIVLPNKLLPNKNNLIINGSFENSKNIGNNIDQSGYNNIIRMQNPGLSPFVLHQKKTNDITYYQLQIDVLQNSKYNLYFWLAFNDDNKQDNINQVDGINQIDFESLIKIKIQGTNFNSYSPRLLYNITQKINFPNQNFNWYLIKYTFTTNDISTNKMNIFLNYTNNLICNNIYFTNISLYRTLVDAESFLYIDKLICYLNGYNYDGSIPVWSDLSGLGNDMYWSNIPVINYTSGSLNTNNLKLEGISSNILSEDKFSIIMCLNKKYDEGVITSEENMYEESYLDNDDKYYLISIPGNEKYAFEIEINNNNLYINVTNEKIESKKEFIINNKSLLTITYDNNPNNSNNASLNIYLDGYNILSKYINKLYFNKNNICINRNKNLNLNLYSILMYNKIINIDEMNKIREYFITNQNMNTINTTNTPNINNYLMDTNIGSFNVSSSSNGSSNFNIPSLLQGYNKKDNKNQKPTHIEGVFDILIDDPNNLLKKNVDKNVDKDVDKNSNITTINQCPTVYKKNGNYMVFIKPNTEYSAKLQYSGEKSYGSNLEKARKSYNINFPNCGTPNELLPGEGKKYIETCPFIINELNPCNTNSCAGINWKTDDLRKLNLNNNCKKSISNYCHINNNLDDNCIAWHPSKKNDPSSIEYRKYFENAKDYCSPNQFNIEDHPDFNKYIKKDNIPCWGCNLNE